MAPTPEKAKGKAPAKAAAPAGVTKKSTKAKQGRSKNHSLGGGVVRFSKTRMFHKKALYKFIGKKAAKAEKVKKAISVVKPIGGDKNGGTRTVLLKKRKSFYPTQDKMPQPKYKKSFSKHVRRTRKNLTPGTVLILLAGRHKGKRVVLLKVLDSGLLLVTGPFKINGCPMRRISQRFVIGTSTRLDISKVLVPEHLNDAYFKKNKKSTKRAVKRKDGEDIFTAKKEKYVASEQRKSDQKTVDDAILALIKKSPERKLYHQYLSAMFRLRSSQYPHRMKF